MVDKNKDETVKAHFARAKARLNLFEQNFLKFKQLSLLLQNDIENIMKDEKIFESLDKINE